MSKIFTKISLLPTCLLWTLSFSTNTTLAAPAVTGTNGIISNNQIVTISGSNFGNKSPAAPLLWNNFSEGANGQPLSTGTGTPWTTQAECVTNYSNAMKYGQSSLAAAQVMRSDAPCWTRTRKGVLGDQTKIFFSYHYYDMPGGTGTHTKMGRVGCNDDVHCTPNMGYTAHSPDYWYAFGNRDKETALSYTAVVSGQWVRDDTWSTLSSDGVANGTVQVWRDGSQVVNNTAVVTKSAGSGHSAYNQVFLPYYNESGNRTVYVGDVYVDNTLARVEICSGSTWSNRGKCEIQPPKNWSSSSVTFTVNQGNILNNSTQYLYIVDSTGAANANGYRVSFGQGQQTAPSPVGLKIN